MRARAYCSAGPTAPVSGGGAISLTCWVARFCGNVNRDAGLAFGGANRRTGRALTCLGGGCGLLRISLPQLPRGGMCAFCGAKALADWKRVMTQLSTVTPVWVEISLTRYLKRKCAVRDRGRLWSFIAAGCNNHCVVRYRLDTRVRSTR